MMDSDISIGLDFDIIGFKFSIYPHFGRFGRLLHSSQAVGRKLLFWACHVLIQTAGECRVERHQPRDWAGTAEHLQPSNDHVSISIDTWHTIPGTASWLQWTLPVAQTATLCLCHHPLGSASCSIYFLLRPRFRSCCQEGSLKECKAINYPRVNPILMSWKTETTPANQPNTRKQYTKKNMQICPHIVNLVTNHLAYTRSTWVSMKSRWWPKGQPGLSLSHFLLESMGLQPT